MQCSSAPPPDQLKNADEKDHREGGPEFPDLRGERGYLTLVPLPSSATVQGPPATEYSSLNVVEVGDSSTSVYRNLVGLPATVSSESEVHVFPVRVIFSLSVSPRLLMP